MKGFILSVLSLLLCTHLACADTLHVWGSSPYPSEPYDAWTNAAHAIQTAVDYASASDTVLVTNGTYNTGGAMAEGMSNRVALTQPIALESVNGPDVTFIVGESYNGTNGPGAVRCVYLTAGATITGFTLTNGHTHAVGAFLEKIGGGALLHNGGRVATCKIIDCTGGDGGGACCYNDGTIENCVISGNSCAIYGGGIQVHSSGGVIRNCTVSGNHSSNRGGGIYADGDGTIQNTVIYGNTSDTDGDNWWDGGGGATYSYCCTTPTTGLPGGGGCIAVNPRFADPLLHLRRDSNCIDAGLEFASVTNDLDGTPRPIDGTASESAATDIGAYEYVRFDTDTDGDGLSDWEEVNIHGTDITLADSDGDTISDPDEIEGGLNPSEDSNSGIADLSMGEMMLVASNGTMQLDLHSSRPMISTVALGPTPVPWWNGLSPREMASYSSVSTESRHAQKSSSPSRDALRRQRHTKRITGTRC